MDRIWFERGNFIQHTSGSHLTERDLIDKCTRNGLLLGSYIALHHYRIPYFSAVGRVSNSLTLFLSFRHGQHIIHSKQLQDSCKPYFVFKLAVPITKREYAKAVLRSSYISTSYVIIAVMTGLVGMYYLRDPCLVVTIIPPKASAIEPLQSATNPSFTIKAREVTGIDDGHVKFRLSWILWKFFLQHQLIVSSLIINVQQFNFDIKSLHQFGVEFIFLKSITSITSNTASKVLLSASAVPLIIEMMSPVTPNKCANAPPSLMD
ncbi:hypothetical protein Bhyg_05936 [Pseudolycoriella hygida]|uniref:Uncharacterized protein n=1 Tax=Pseudolycoriella hygida TaxID=35572 RepID=A0A9Q0MZU6_9DIPT|nr:hypothetical protein Bhyg_05936 [Pseudolycoriella hygida]